MPEPQGHILRESTLKDESRFAKVLKFNNVG